MFLSDNFSQVIIRNLNKLLYINPVQLMVCYQCSSTLKPRNEDFLCCIGPHRSRKLLFIRESSNFTNLKLFRFLLNKKGIIIRQLLDVRILKPFRISRLLLAAPLCLNLTTKQLPKNV